MSSFRQIENFDFTSSRIPLETKLSMVSGNGVSPTARPNFRSYRKMADIGVQYEPQESEFCNEPPVINSTVAEINTSSELVELDTSTSVPAQPSFNRPLSIDSSTSSSNGEDWERRKKVTNQEVDVDAICVQQSAVEEDVVPELNENKKSEKTEPDGFVLQEKEDTSCGLDCLYFTMQCCECTIL